MVWQNLAWRWLANAAVGGSDRAGAGRPGGAMLPAAGPPVAAGRPDPPRRLIVPAIMAIPAAPRWSAGLLPAVAPARAEDGANDSDVATRRRTRDDRGGRAARYRSASDAGLAVANRARGRVRWIRHRCERCRRARGVEPRTGPLAGHIPIAYLAVSVGMAAWWLFGQVVAVAGEPRGKAGDRGRPRPIPRHQRAGRRSRPAAGERPDRAAVHLHLDPAGDPAAGVALRRRRRPGPAATAWRTSGRTSSVATPGPGTSRPWPGCVLFYQPLFWWLRRQLRLCQDYLADDRAAAIGSPEDYAAYLVRLARSRQSGLPLPALGVGDRRSNLYRRVVMLVQDREPLEHRCRTAWSLAAGLIAALVIAGVSGLRLEAAVPARAGGRESGRGEGRRTRPRPAARPKLEQGRTYVGQVTDKDTGKPIAGASVLVRLSLSNDPKTGTQKTVEEIRQTTDSEGRYRFTITPEQSGRAARSTSTWTSTTRAT